MDKVIQKAVEGDYEPFKTVKMSELTCELHGSHYGCNFKDSRVKGICGADIHRFLLDPKLWQCLTKARCKDAGLREHIWKELWEDSWIGFIKHLASGGDITNFFTALLGVENDQ